METHLEVVYNDGVISLDMVVPGHGRHLPLFQLAVVRFWHIHPVTHTVQILVQLVHQESQELIGILLGVALHVWDGGIHHQLEVPWCDGAIAP